MSALTVLAATLSASAARPLPLAGRAGVGVHNGTPSLWTPTPNPSPQGGGERSVLGGMVRFPHD